jgi:hypothetical protein
MSANTFNNKEIAIKAGKKKLGKKHFATQFVRSLTKEAFHN